MPPEPPPWDRRDFVFREKKHDRGAPYPDALGGGGGGSSLPRWRETCHAAREFPTPSPRRPPSGYYRHGGGGGYHSLFPDEPCSRSEDDGFRTYQSSRHGGGSSRSTNNNRESVGYVRRSSWDSGDFPRQHHDAVASQRSVADPLSQPSPHLTPIEDQHDKIGGGVDDGSRTGHKHDRDLENSLGSLQWKPLKWNRSGSFSSSSKGVRSEQSEEGRLEVAVPPGKETPVESPVESPLPSDDGLFRKRQRLGWGQGLAKYEKEKFEGADDGGRKSLSIKASPGDASPKLMGLPGSASPTTPASMTCSSSQGGEDKYFSKVANNDVSTNLSNAPCHEAEQSLENFSINSENLDFGSLNHVSSLLADLLDPEDACYADSNFMRQTAMHKLLLLKGTILKQLETTESEIDLFENELKNLNSECDRSDSSQRSVKTNSECEISDPCQGSSKIPVNHPSNFSGEHTGVVTEVSNRSASALASAVAPSVGNGPSNGLLGEANEQGDFSPGAVEFGSHFSSIREKETSDPDSLKASVLEGGAMSDAARPLPSAIGNEPVASCGSGSPPDVGTSGNVVCSAMNFGQECCGLTALIMAFNRESAKRASEVLGISFPINSSSCQAVGSCDNVLDKQKESHIRKKLAMHKYFLRFKERVLTLKYRAFQHLWKEDLRLLSIRKHRSKSQKRFELNCRSSQNGSQKNRSSLRSRFALSGNLTMVPTSEILDFTSKLLSDSQIKLYRNNLRMPALILDEREKKYSRFDTNNGLLEDPCSFEKEKTMINPWTAEEREIFMEMLAMYGKDFTKIACFLSHKTTADCIEFYYKNHKSESFEKVKKSLGLRKNRQVIPSNSYLLTSGKKWKRETNAASLDVLGAASMIASQADDNMRVQHRFSGRSTFGSHHDIRMPRGTCAAFEMSSSVNVLGQEQETSAADVLIGICGAVSSEAMSSCVTTSFDPGEKMNYIAADRHLASEVTQSVDEDTCSDEGCGELDSVDWTDEEKSTFISALSSYGRDFVRISHCVGTRSKEQCKIFFSKARKCLGLDVFLRGTLCDANIDKSDTEDACMFEIDSAICSTQSCSKVEADFTHSAANDSSGASGQAADIPLQTDLDTCSLQCEIGLSSQEEVKTKMEKLGPCLNSDDTVLSKKQESACFMEGKAVKVELGSNVSPQLDESAGRHPGVEREKDENVPAESPGGSVSTDEKVRVERVDSCTSTELLQTAGAEKGLTGDCFRAEFELKRSLVPKNERDDKQQLEIFSKAENIARSPLFVSEINSSDNARLPDDKEQKVNAALPASTLLPQPLPIVHYEDRRQAAAPRQSSFKFEDNANKQQKISTSKDIYQQYLSAKHSSVGHSAPILRGYPLQVFRKKEMNGQAQSVCERSVLLNSCPNKSGVAQPAKLLLPDSHGENGSSCYRSQLGSGIPFLPKDNEHADAQLRPCPRSSSKDTDQSVRTGDVKLFGQILSHPTPAQRSNSPARGNEHKPSNSGQGSSLNLLNGHTDGALPPPREGRSHHHQSRQEMPGRDYEMWSDNGVERGISTVPESGMFLAKYPGSNLSCYTVKDHPGSCGFVQQAFLQPLTLDGNRSEISLDLQKHNGFEGLSAFQHQGRVSLSRIAGSSILVSSKGCTGVSDPVAALKMHYAARTGVFRGEEESWRTDIGR